MDPYFTLLIKINSKWIKDLNVRPKTVKFLEENTGGKKIPDTSLGNDFLDKSPKAQAKKTEINKWNYIKLKSFYTVKEIINKLKKKSYRMGENILKPYIH